MTTANVVFKGTDKTKAAIKSVNAGLAKVHGAVTSTSAKLLALAGVGGFGALIKSSYDTIGALNDAAQKIGVTTDALQSMQYAAQLFSAGGAAAMNEALTKASKRLGEFNQTGGGAAAGWLKELHFDTQNLASLSPDQLFNTYADAIGNMNDRGKQLAAISALMGDESRALIGIIDKGSGAFKEAQKELELFGVKLNDVDTQKIDIASTAFERTQTIVKGLGQQIAIALTPILTILNDKIANTAKEAGGMGNLVQTAFRKVLIGIGWVRDAAFFLEIGFKNLEVKVIDFAASAIEKIAQVAESTRRLSNEVLRTDIKPFTDLNKTLLDIQVSGFKLHNEIDGLFDKSKPSEELLDSYDKAAAKIQKQAEAAAAAAKAQNELNNSQANVPETKIDRTSREQGILDAQDRLAAISESFMTERQLLDEHLAQKQFDIEADFQDGYIKESQRKEALAMLEVQHQAKLLQIETDADKERVAREKAVQDKIRDMRYNALSNAASLLQQFAGKSKAAAIAAIAINKGLSIARAVQNTAAAVTQALASLPYPASLAAAAQIKTIGAINIGLIAASGFAQAANLGGGGAGGAVAAGGAGLTPSRPALPPIPEQGSRASITIIGASRDEFVSTQAIADAFKEAHDSDEIVINFQGQRATIV